MPIRLYPGAASPSTIVLRSTTLPVEAACGVVGSASIACAAQLQPAWSGGGSAALAINTEYEDERLALTGSVSQSIAAREQPAATVTGSQTVTEAARVQPAASIAASQTVTAAARVQAAQVAGGGQTVTDAGREGEAVAAGGSQSATEAGRLRGAQAQSGASTITAAGRVQAADAAGGSAAIAASTEYVDEQLAAGGAQGLVIGGQVGGGATPAGSQSAAAGPQLEAASTVEGSVSISAASPTGVPVEPPVVVVAGGGGGGGGGLARRYPHRAPVSSRSVSARVELVGEGTLVTTAVQRAGLRVVPGKATTAAAGIRARMEPLVGAAITVADAHVARPVRLPVRASDALPSPVVESAAIPIPLENSLPPVQAAVQLDGGSNVDVAAAMSVAIQASGSTDLRLTIVPARPTEPRTTEQLHDDVAIIAALYLQYLNAA